MSVRRLMWECLLSLLKFDFCRAFMVNTIHGTILVLVCCTVLWLYSYCELCLWLGYTLDSQIFWRSGLPVICCSKPNNSNTDFMERNISIMQNTELSFVFMQNYSHLGSRLSWVAWNNLFCDNPSFCIQCISKHGKFQAYRCNAFQMKPNTDVPLPLIFAIELLFLHK